MRSQNLSAVEQPELALARKVDSIEVSTDLVMKQQSLSGAISLCVQLSGLEDKEVYLTLEIDAGHWTRIMKGDAHFPVNKLNQLMDLCGNEAPVVWLSRSRGYALVQIETETQRLLRIERDARLEAEKENDFLKKLIMGRS